MKRLLADVNLLPGVKIWWIWAGLSGDILTNLHNYTRGACEGVSNQAATSIS